MVLLVLLILLVLSISYWLFQPLLQGLTPLLSSTGLGWLALGAALWLLAGRGSDDPPANPKP